jgi:hypothetical protein
MDASYQFAAMLVAKRWHYILLKFTTFAGLMTNDSATK